MSFSNDLWNSFPKIQNDFSLKYNQLKCLSEVFHYLFKVEMKFSKEMKLIYDLKNSIEIQGNLSNLLNEFFKSIEDISIIYKEHAESINDRLITPLNKFMINQLELTQKLFEEAGINEQKEIEKEKKLASIKEEFHNNCLHLINATIFFELTIAKIDINIDEMNNALKAKLAANEKVKESKLRYLKYLENINSYQEYQNSVMEIGLNDGQTYYSSLINFFTWIFIATETFNKELIDKLRNGNENRLAVYHSIDSQALLNEFVYNNISTNYPHHHYNFESFKINKQFFEGVGLPKKTIDNIRETMNDKFKCVDNTFNKLAQDTKHNISDFIHQLWSGVIDSEKKAKVFDLLKENKANRLYLLYVINGYRNHGLFAIANNVYSLLIEILSIIVDYCSDNNDFNTIQSIIMISQTYYTEDKSHLKDSRRELHLELLSHPIFQKKVIWMGIIKYAINEEIYKKKDLYDNASDVGNKNIKSMVRVILMTYLFNMQSFKLPKDIIQEIAGYFCRSYKITDELLSDNDMAIEENVIKFNNNSTSTNKDNSTSTSTNKEKNEEIEIKINPIHKIDDEVLNDNRKIH